MNSAQDTVLSNYIESRLTKLETNQENITETLLRLDRRMESLEKSITTGFDKVSDRIWSNFYWVMGTNIALMTTFAGLILRTIKG